MTQRTVLKLDLDALRNYALRALSMRGLSVSELQLKLKQRAEAPGDVATVLGSLQSYGYIDDQRLSEGIASSRAQGGNTGAQRVVRDLLKKRIPPAVAREAVSQAFKDVDEPALIREYLARKMRGKNLGEYLKEPKNLASLYRKLRVAGFSSPSSIRVLKSYSEHAEELEELDSASGEAE
jgi:SOS response regulatory protein OraA/RecX